MPSALTHLGPTIVNVIPGTMGTDLSAVVSVLRLFEENAVGSEAFAGRLLKSHQKKERFWCHTFDEYSYMYFDTKFRAYTLTYISTK